MKGNGNMAQRLWFRVFGLAVIAFMLMTALVAQTVDTEAIQQRLNAQFKLTATTADRWNVVTSGDVVAIHKPGLLMYAVDSPMPPSNTYKNGKITQGWSGFGKDLMISMAAPGGASASDFPHRPFMPEEKCWVTGIQVQKDGVVFQLYSDPYDDIRYYASLKIPFPSKKEVPSSDEALQLVAQVLTVVPWDDRTRQQAPAPPPATLPEIAPPSPPADGPSPIVVPPPTIELGQTKNKVISTFGQPDRKEKVGENEIYYYKDMRVTFTSGRVSDVD
jgi:hypothetical protein